MQTFENAVESLLNTAHDPERTHPKTDFSLTQAVMIAIGHTTLSGKKEPATLDEVRSTLREMDNAARHTWLTGMAALDLLDAELDGRDLSSDSRFP